MSHLVDVARAGAWLVMRPERETLVVTGPERHRWLNGMVTCDVAQLAAGQGVHGLALNKSGKIQSDVDVVATRESLMVGVAPETGHLLFEAFSRMLVMEDAELAESTADWSWIAIHGGHAVEIGTELARKLPSAIFAPIDWTGIGSAALVVRRDEQELAATVVPPPDGLEFAAPSDWEVLRLELGYAEFGVDYGPAHTPHDASLERRSVAWNKGCYLGQEVVCKQDARGRARWRLVSLEIAGPSPAPAGSPVLGAELDEPVGEVTSSTPSVAAGRAVALARLKSSYAEEGTRLLVLGREARVRSQPVGAPGFMLDPQP